jgi:hypothetical protein
MKSNKKSKSPPSRKKRGKDKAPESTSLFKVRDRVRIVDIAEYLKDPNYDLKDAGYREMRTAELFRFCIGREFTIKEFDEYGHAEIDASANRSVRKEFGTYHSIWSEPEFLELVRPVKADRNPGGARIQLAKRMKKDLNLGTVKG